MTSGPLIGFACRWYHDRPEATWSGTPWQLRRALAERTALTELGPRFPARLEQVAKLAYLRRQRGRWVSQWTQSAAFDRLAERQVRRRADDAGVDVVLQMMDYAVTDQPFHVYQDLSHALLVRRFDSGAPLPDEFNRLSVQRLRQGVDRQAALYQAAASVICMSDWLARDVVASGIDATRVHVVNPGVVDHGAAPRPVERPRSGRLILVGADARRKGLASVVAALPRIRRTFPDATLTVVGPAVWPLSTPPPAGVELLGPRSPQQVAQLLPEHDLFVMPSQWEGFGIAFCEALLAGLPVIGRADCAMPEIVRAPRYGDVVGRPDELSVPPTELADAVVACLLDDELYERVAADRGVLRGRYSWAAAAERILAIMGPSVAPAARPVSSSQEAVRG